MDSPAVKKLRTRRDGWESATASVMAQNTLNPIRRIVDEMKLTPNPEKEMIALSIGDPTVFGNLAPCEVAKNAIIEVVQNHKHNGYAPSIGYERARKAVADHYGCPEAPLTEKDVIFASGCSGALDLCISGLASAGQNILCPRPGFSVYKTLANSVGIEVHLYNLIPERSWEVDLKHMESMVDDNTAAIVVNNPSNPCGSVYSQQHILDILDVAHRLKVPIIADEIYADFVYPGNKFYSLASQTDDVPILSCNGLTKRWLVPGWRMGWITIHDRHSVFEKEIVPGLIHLSQRILGPNTLMQGALEKILRDTPAEFFQASIDICKKNADICYSAMSKMPGLKPIMPQGAMYMMIGFEHAHYPDFKDELEFTQRMVTEQSVFCLPGRCFEYADYFRVVLTVPEEKMVEACNRIAQFCQKHYVADCKQTNGPPISNSSSSQNGM